VITYSTNTVDIFISIKIINDICKILSIVGINDNIMVLVGNAHPTEYYSYATQAITN
jgi:hypothetical protein